MEFYIGFSGESQALLVGAFVSSQESLKLGTPKRFGGARWSAFMIAKLLIIIGLSKLCAPLADDLPRGDLRSFGSGKFAISGSVVLQAHFEGYAILLIDCEKRKLK